MATQLPETPDTDRRVVLIDFDWRDADLMPELLRRAGTSVSLVVGEGAEDPGIRVAELCGVRSTTELADLTREIFDLAVVSERSSRRGPVERLLKALGTPFETPDCFLERPMDGSKWMGMVPSGRDDEDALASSGIHNGDNGQRPDPMIEIAEAAVLDLSLATEEPDPARDPAALLGEIPRLGDRAALDRALLSWALATGASTAELWSGRSGRLERRCRTGVDDPLLEAMVRTTMSSGAARVVAPIDGVDQGRGWGAWPLVTPDGRMVLAAASIHPVEGTMFWERAARELSERSLHPEPSRAAIHDDRTLDGWLAPHSFRSRLELALERNRRDGFRFAVHRIRFGEAGDAVERLCRELPHRLRGTDFLCRSGAAELVLLTAGAPASLGHLRRRLVALWEQTWLEGGGTEPAPPITDERADLVGPEDAERFMSVAERWLAAA